MNSRKPEKICECCGRSFQWRKQWSDCWDEVRYCSRACRAYRLQLQVAQLRGVILQQLATKAPGATLCPSEAAQSLAGGGEWQTLLEPARMAARLLAHGGEIEILQQGKPVNPAQMKGPVRLRKRRQ